MRDALAAPFFKAPTEAVAGRLLAPAAVAAAAATLPGLAAEGGGGVGGGGWYAPGAFPQLARRCRGGGDVLARVAPPRSQADAPAAVGRHQALCKLGCPLCGGIKYRVSNPARRRKARAFS